MAKHVKKVQSRTAGWLVIIATLVVAGVSVGQLASATPTGGTTTTTKKRDRYRRTRVGALT